MGIKKPMIVNRKKIVKGERKMDFFFESPNNKKPAITMIGIGCRKFPILKGKCHSLKAVAETKVEGAGCRNRTNNPALIDPKRTSRNPRANGKNERIDSGKRLRSCFSDRNKKIKNEITVAMKAAIIVWLIE